MHGDAFRGLTLTGNVGEVALDAFWWKKDLKRSSPCVGCAVWAGIWGNCSLEVHAPEEELVVCLRSESQHRDYSVDFSS